MILLSGGCNSYRIIKNATQMEDYASGSSALISPYGLANAAGAPDCSPFDAGDPHFFSCGDGANGNVFCGPPNFLTASTSHIAGCSGGTSSFSIGPFHNCYYQSNETASLPSTCNVIGRKNVYAKKAWLGIRAYDSPDWGAPDYMSYCGTCKVVEERTSPDTTKYLTLTAEASYTETVTSYGCVDGGAVQLGEPVVYEGTAAGYSTVNSSSGNVTSTCSSGSVDAAIAIGLLGAAEDNITAMFSKFDELYSTAITATSAAPDSITGDGTYWDLVWHVDKVCRDKDGFITSTESVILYQLSVDLAGGTLNWQTFGEDNQSGGGVCRCYISTDGTPCCPAWIKYSEEQWEYNDIGFIYTSTTVHESASTKTIIEKSVTGTLSDPYTNADAIAEAEAMLGNWSLGDDYTLPWQHPNTVGGPIVYRDEGILSMPNLLCQDQIYYTGDVVGLPFSKSIDVNGNVCLIDKVWSPFHANYCVCFGLVDPDSQTHYVRDYGAWSDTSGTPAATAWLNDREMGNVPQGAFVMSNLQWTVPSTTGAPAARIIDDVVWVCKTAEAILPNRQSYDWARPCGVDRFQPLAGSPRCIVSASGNILALEPTATATDISTSDLLWVCGTGTLDGLWTGSVRDGDYQITLGGLAVSATNIASQPIFNCGSGMVTRLRWGNTLKPAICGTLGITALTSNAPITASLAEGSYLTNLDSVMVHNSNGVPSINNTTQSVIAIIDATHIALIGTNGSGSTYTGGGYFTSPNAHPGWHSTKSKNTYGSFEYTHSFRDIAEYNRLVFQYSFISGSLLCDGVTNCGYNPTPPANPRITQAVCGLHQNVKGLTVTTNTIERNPCGISVAYYSPNVEHFVTSSGINSVINHGFGTVAIDGYGSLWQGVFKQFMDDPLAQTPNCPCEANDIGVVGCNGCDYVEDNGECASDQVANPDLGQLCKKYYPHRDQFEWISSQPSGSPALPSGVYIGCLTPSDFVSGSPCPSGNILNPPSFNANLIYFLGDVCGQHVSLPFSDPWSLLINEENCVCSEGRFADQYRSNGVRCLTGEVGI